MEYENKDYKGRATGGLVTGIIGTSLAGLLASGAMGNCNGQNSGGLFGNLLNFGRGNCNDISAYQAEISQLKSERYTDYVGMDLYKNIIAFSNAEDAKIAALQKEVTAYVIDLDKRTALNAQAAELNRQYDNLARDAGFKLLEQKLECCCEKANARIDCLTDKTAMGDAAILSYINSTFLPGTLKLPATSICPQPTTTA